MKAILLTFIIIAAIGAGVRPAAVKNKSSMPDLRGATGWLNSTGLSAADLRGKIVLVDFWTFTCVNWMRTLPYTRAWAERYKSAGLVVIGVHTPEFSFEKDAINVSKAVDDLNIGYPVALDNNYSIWHAFSNNYWPAVYLLDGKGAVRYQHFGEGSYEATEIAIQQLLIEAGAKNIPAGLAKPAILGAELAADADNLLSAENYLGYARTKDYVNDCGKMNLNEWTYAGAWKQDKDVLRLRKANGKIIYRFHARDLNMVMGPATKGQSVRFRVTIDGLEPGGAHGADCNDSGIGVLDGQRLYQVIRQPGAIGERTFEIEFLDPGVEVFSFTFG